MYIHSSNIVVHRAATSLSSRSVPLPCPALSVLWIIIDASALVRRSARVACPIFANAEGAFTRTARMVALVDVFTAKNYVSLRSND